MRRQQIKRAAYVLSKPFSIRNLIKLTGQNFIFPFYHLVSDLPPRYVKSIFPVSSVSQFNKDLDFLLANYSPASINDILTYINKKWKKI